MRFLIRQSFPPGFREGEERFLIHAGDAEHLCGAAFFAPVGLVDDADDADQDFIDSVSKGLEARWEFQEQHQDEDTAENLKEAVSIELQAVEGYENATFEDGDFQEKALQYIDILNETLENVEYYYLAADNEDWEVVYYGRALLLKDFVSNYGLTVSNKYKSILDELVVDGKLAEDELAQWEALEKIVDDLEFELIEDNYGYRRYVAVLENTSEYDIEFLSLNMNLLDADGVIVDTAYDSVEHVSKGQKVRIEFSTMEDIDAVDPIIEWFEVE